MNVPATTRQRAPAAPPRFVHGSVRRRLLADVLRQITGLKAYTTPVMLPGVSLSTAPDDYEIYGAIRLQRFDGRSWVPFGEPMQR